VTQSDDVMPPLRAAYDGKVEERDAHPVEAWTPGDFGHFQALLLRRT
jgi:hypothetical protein